MSPLLLLGLAACQGWPLHAHLDADTAQLWPAGSTPDHPVSFTAAGELAPAPSTPVALATDQGLTWAGALLGPGVDPDAEVDRGSENLCELESDFPPRLREGDYRGEVGWATVSAGVRGTLCAAAEADGAGLDLLLYDLSRCEIPQGPVYDRDADDPLGFDGDGAVAWSAPVGPESTWGVALAAHSPDDAAGEIDYNLQLALVPLADDGGPGTCPGVSWSGQ